MKIIVGSDHRGFSAKRRVLHYLRDQGHQAEDAGTYTDQACDYPEVAAEVARAIVHSSADRGILICGTGIGMSIAANKFPGIRAAPVSDDVTAELARRHNDCNVLCLSGDLLGEQRMDRILDIWLATPFEGGRHSRRIEKIHGFENGRGQAVLAVKLANGEQSAEEPTRSAAASASSSGND